MVNYIKSLISKESLKKLSKLAVGHKIISFIVILIILVGGYFILAGGEGDEIRYVLGTVEKGTITVAVDGSGQVSDARELNIKSKVSGDVVYVGVKSGDAVKAGHLLFQIDARNAQRAVRDTEIALESAKISLEKIKKPAENSSLVQAQNSFDSAKEKLEKSYGDAFSAVSDSFLELPGVVSGLQNILYGQNVSGSGQDNVSAYSDMVKTYDPLAVGFKEDSTADYAEARNSFDASLQKYQSVSRFSGESEIKSLTAGTYQTLRTVAEAIKSLDGLLGLVEDELNGRGLNLPSSLSGHRADLNSYASQINSRLSSTLSAANAIVAAEREVIENGETLTDVRNGADLLDVASAELNVRQKENSLADAKEKLADYYIRAPFDAVVAAVEVKKSDDVSLSMVLGTLIAGQKLAEVSLNEVDIAQVKTGQKAELTFDAAGDLSVEGLVSEVDLLGVSDQGVVTYDVKIAFKTEDERVKPGMSVNASVITEVKSDVLVVPNGAVKTQGRFKYVETLDEKAVVLAQSNLGDVSLGPTERKNIEIGLSDDLKTEVIFGLNEGDQIIIRTAGSANGNQNPQAPTLFGPSSGGQRSGGNIRVIR